MGEDKQNQKEGHAQSAAHRPISDRGETAKRHRKEDCPQKCGKEPMHCQPRVSKLLKNTRKIKLIARSRFHKPADQPTKIAQKQRRHQGGQIHDQKARQDSRVPKGISLFRALPFPPLSKFPHPSQPQACPVVGSVR